MIKYWLILSLLFSGFSLAAENFSPVWVTMTNIGGSNIITGFYTNRPSQILEVELVGEISSSIRTKEYSELDLVKIKLAKKYELAGKDEEFIRSCIIDHVTYKVHYIHYPQGPSYVVGGDSYFPAFIVVTKLGLTRRQISPVSTIIEEGCQEIKQFMGCITYGGGSEDIPQNMVYQALGLTNRVNESKDWIAESWQDKASAEKK